jgi:acetyl esterase
MQLFEPTLEPAAQAFAVATAKPPFRYELGPEGARQVLDDVQAAPIGKAEVQEKWITVPGRTPAATAPSPTGPT